MSILENFDADIEALKEIEEQEQQRKGMTLPKTILISVLIHVGILACGYLLQIALPMEIEKEHVTEITLEFNKERIAPEIADRVMQTKVKKEKAESLQREQAAREKSKPKPKRKNKKSATAHSSPLHDDAALDRGESDEAYIPETTEGSNIQAIEGTETEEPILDLFATGDDESAPAETEEHDTAVYQHGPVQNIAELGLTAEPSGQPVYPPALKARGIEGEVVIMVTFDASGRAVFATVKPGYSSGYLEFDRNATAWAMEYRITARPAGSPDIQGYTAPITFRLQ